MERKRRGGKQAVDTEQVAEEPKLSKEERRQARQVKRQARRENMQERLRATGRAALPRAGAALGVTVVLAAGGYEHKIIGDARGEQACAEALPAEQDVADLMAKDSRLSRAGVRADLMKDKKDACPNPLAFAGQRDQQTREQILDIANDNVRQLEENRFKGFISVDAYHACLAGGVLAVAGWEAGKAARQRRIEKLSWGYFLPHSQAIQDGIAPPYAIAMIRDQAEALKAAAQPKPEPAAQPAPKAAPANNAVTVNRRGGGLTAGVPRSAAPAGGGAEAPADQAAPTGRLRTTPRPGVASPPPPPPPPVGQGDVVGWDAPQAPRRMSPAAPQPAPETDWSGWDDVTESSPLGEDPTQRR